MSSERLVEEAEQQQEANRGKILERWKRGHLARHSKLFQLAHHEDAAEGIVQQSADAEAVVLWCPRSEGFTAGRIYLHVVHEMNRLTRT